MGAARRTGSGAVLMTGKNGPVEPSAAIRQMASALRQMYVALVAEGFSDRQALVIIGQVVSADAHRDDDES